MQAQNLDAWWMPFTANRHFKANPRLLVSANGIYYTDDAGRQIIDGTSGLWCVNAGHNRRQIVEAIQKQAATLDYSPPFQMGHPYGFKAAERLIEMAPKGLTHAFFVGSGSEAADTSMKIAMAYHRVRGDGQRVKFIGRERGYHGVNFGGIAVGGMAGNRKHFPVNLPGIDHIRSTHDLARNAFSKGQPEFGVELANELEHRINTLHDPSTIAAVIVEPMQGSSGVILPPKGYLERLREICTKYGILLIFDEVITGFGRLGHDWGASAFNTLPDILNCAKGLTNGSVPMGAVLVKPEIHDVFMTGPERAIELPHGYTYSAHPLAAAAAIATLDLYREENIFGHAAQMAPFMEAAAHALRGHKNVIDIRNMGMVAAVEFSSREGALGARAMDIFLKCWDKGLMVRCTGDIIAIAPPLIIEKEEIGRIFTILAEAIDEVA